MQRLPHISIISALVLLALSGAGDPARGDPPEFHAFLLPEVGQVQIGQTLEVRFEVDTTAVQFNGYEVTIRYDPRVVRLEDVEQGSLMTGACGSTFFIVDEAESTVTVSHVILCGPNPSSLDGPGVLSTYRFAGLAEGISALTILSDPDSTFADGGTPINPEHPTFPRQVVLHDALIRVEEMVGVAGESPRGPAGDHLLPNVPNPFNPVTELRFQVTSAGPVRLDVADAMGRLVSSRHWDRLEAGTHRLSWRAVTGDGTPLPSGVYWCRLTTVNGTSARGITLVR